MVLSNSSILPFQFSLILLILFFSIQTDVLSEEQVLSTASSPDSTQSRSQSADQTETILTDSFDFNDVFRIELEIDFTSNIEVRTSEDNDLQTNSIHVSIQQNIKEESDQHIKLSSENILLNGVFNEGVLQLKTELLDIPTDINYKSHLTYSIITPPDVSLKIRADKGNINIHNIRGNLEITAEEGNINLFETLGTYSINLSKGYIKGSLLLTPDQSNITTRNGSIELIVLDNLAAPLKLTALGGGIRLLLPKDYPADLAYSSVKEQILINVPAEIDDNSGLINDGGPLLNLTSTGMISILPAPTLQGNSDNSQSDYSDDITSDIDISLPKTSIRPIIDGDLSEKAWFYATQLTPFLSHDGNEIEDAQTDVSLMYDDKFLYVGAKIYFADDIIPRVSQTQLDSPIWEDECIEIVLDMNPQTQKYHHIVINPIGAVFDQLVEKTGYPTLKFHPSNVRKINLRHNYVNFKGDSTWNSDVIVETKINSGYWSLELALKRSFEDEIDPNTWLLNIHRKAQGTIKGNQSINRLTQREYSYWMPTYNDDHPWWPHSTEVLGTISFEENNNYDESSTFANNLKISSIEIGGNNIIPSNIILEQLPFSTGSIISNEQLSWMLDVLSGLDWFKDVNLKSAIVEKTKNEEIINPDNEPPIIEDTSIDGNPKVINNPVTSVINVNLQFEVTESPIKYIRKVSIEGNKSFPASFIMNWFNIGDGYIVDSNIDIKKQMVEDFYINRGFSFAKVTDDRTTDELILNIHEGYVDEIRFTGNRRISHQKLTEAFDFDKNEVFFHSLIQSEITKLKNRLIKTDEEFKSIADWYIQREGGKNLLIIEIEEQPIFQPGWFPIIGFNRVHGTIIGAGGTVSTKALGNEQLFVSVRRGFTSEKWNYRFGIEDRSFNFLPLTFGTGFYRLTDSSTQVFRFRPADFDLNAALYGSSAVNYYERYGSLYWLTRPIGLSSQFRLGVRIENHNNLSKTTDWSYFLRSRVKNGNLRIEEGQHNLLSLSYTFDTRDRKSLIGRTDEFGGELILWPNERSRRGWRGNIEFQTSGKTLGGDFSYRLYSFQINKYTKITGPHNINIRVAGDFSDSSLPRQRLLYLGGFTTLRGYPLNAFAGDNRVIFNVEYRLLNEILIDPRSDLAIGMSFYTFMDSGKTWEFGENPFSDSSQANIYTSIGLGLSWYISPQKGLNPFSAAVEFAFPVNESYYLKSYPIILRLERLF
ncbi:BamA/TamA family outer membrane protein [Candidatus Poribacteria bacterium]|nr:BamA/TamA family outer membrane protein [Candidatus Poribacteria bacterium]